MWWLARSLARSLATRNTKAATSGCINKTNTMRGAILHTSRPVRPRGDGFPRTIDRYYLEWTPGVSRFESSTISISCLHPPHGYLLTSPFSCRRLTMDFRAQSNLPEIVSR